VGARRERSYSVGGDEDDGLVVVPPKGGRGIRPGSTVHLETTISNVDDPVLGQPGPGIERTLETTIKLEGGVGNLHDEGRPRGMGIEKIERLAPDHGEVGLRFRLIIERDRGLLPHCPPWSESLLEGVSG
jgi:hypothetical protein